MYGQEYTSRPQIGLPRLPALPLFAVLAAVLYASSGLVAAPKAVIGKDDFTGKPIFLLKGRAHPILEGTRKRFDGKEVDLEAIKKRLLERRGDIVDLDFVYDSFSRAARKEVSDWFRSQFYARYGCSCNNGRPGSLFSWRTAIVLEDEDLAAQVLSDIKHWLGHDTTCSGHSTDFRDYDYCYGGYPGTIAAFAGYLEGLDPATLRVPAFPDPDSDRHDGFVQPFAEKNRARVVWKGLPGFLRRHLNICSPSGHVPPINDSGDHVYRHKHVGSVPAGFDLRSRNMRSEVVLLAGQLNRDALWGKTDPILKEKVPGADAFYVLFDTAPDNDVHNHLDALQIVLWRWGKYLLWDIGSDCAGDGYTYENGRYTHQTYAHNTVVVDQLPQLPTHPQVLFFGEVPGLKAAEADAGWTHDSVFHRRVLALTEDYLVDVSLLRPRRGHEQEQHDFDYLLTGPGTATIKLLGPKRPVRRKDHPSCEYWGAWPNLPVNYRYIDWAEPYEVQGGFESGWELDGTGLRTIVLSKDFIRACIGHARASNYDTLGLAKLYAGYRGTQAQFFSVIEPYQQESRIAAVEQLDDSCCRIEMKGGDVDYVQVNRRSPRFLTIRTGTDGVIKALRALEARTVFLGDSQIEADREALDGLALELDGAKARLYAESPEAQTLFVPVGKAVSASAGGKPMPLKDGRVAVSLSKGKTILELEFNAAPDLHYTRDDALKSGAANPQRELAEIVDPDFPHTSELVWDEAYRRPYVYADGAYWGEDGLSACAVAMSADGNCVAYGSYKGYVDTFTGEGKRRWRKYVSGRVIEDYYHRGKGVAVSPDGSLVAIGTTAGQALLLDAKGQVIWEKTLGEDVVGVALDAEGSVFLATAKQVSLVGKEGAVRYALAVEGHVDDIYLLEGGEGALYTTYSGLIGRLDRDGKEIWSYRSNWDTGVYTVVASSNGKRAYAGRVDKHVVALNDRGKVLWEHFVEVPPVAMACSRDGKYLAVSGDGGRVYYFDSSGKLHWVFQCASMCYGIAMSEDGEYVSAVATCGTVYLLSRAGKLISHNAVYTPEPVKCAISADGRYTAVAGIGFDLLYFRNAVGR